MFDLEQEEIPSGQIGLIRRKYKSGRYSVMASFASEDENASPFDVCVLGPGRCNVRVSGRNALSNAHIIAAQLDIHAARE